MGWKIGNYKNNEWLEKAIKKDKLILGMNDLYDEDVVLIFLDEFTKKNIRIDEEDYIIREASNQIRVMCPSEFEELYEGHRQ